MIEEKTMGITTTLKKTYPRKGGEGEAYSLFVSYSPAPWSEKEIAWQK